MSDLAQLQRAMAEGLLSGRFEDIVSQVRPGPIAAAEALSIHRNTALHGLVQALRLSHPTVDALTGEAFFDQAALAFIDSHPPSSPWLTPYGSAFADFLRAYPPASSLPYLADVARLDFAIDAVANDALGRDGLQFDLGEALLTLDASVRVIQLDWPAAAIRDAVEAGDEALAPLSFAFLSTLFAGGDLEALLSDVGDFAPLQSEVFAAPFARLILK
jgi:hypothetical protein